MADFETYYRQFLVDLNGDGVPDATVQAPARRPTPAEMVGGVPNYPEKFGPRLDEFNTQGAPLFDTPDSGDLFTLRYGGQRVGGIPDPRMMSPPTWDGAKNVLSNVLNMGMETAAAAGQASGPPGAILVNGARVLRNLPATVGAAAERVGQVFAGGRQGAADAAENILMAPQMAATGFRRGNVTPAEMSAPWQRLPDEVGAQNPLTSQVWEAAKVAEQNAARSARDAAMPTVSPQNLLMAGPSTAEFAQSVGAARPSQAQSFAGRLPPNQSFIWQKGGVVAEGADPTLAAARQQAIRQDQQRMTGLDISSAPPPRQPAQSLPGDAMADAVVGAYLPQPGFRDVFTRDPMRVLGELQQSTGIDAQSLLTAMERAGFDLSFMTRDKFMTREGGRISGYFAPGGKEAFQQIQQSPVLYRGRDMSQPTIRKPDQN